MPAPDQVPENYADRLRALTGKIQASFLDYGTRIKRANRVAKVILVVVGAALAGCGQFAPEPYVAIGRVVGVAGVFLAFVGGFWSFVVDDSAANLMSEAQTAIEEATAMSAELTSLKREIEREREQFNEERLDYEDNVEVISQLYTTSAALREFVENEVVRYDGNIGKTMQKLLDMVARQIHELLAFNGGEHWTLSVFQAFPSSEAGNVLKHIAGQRADRNDEVKEHRSWGPGEGAVGHCFQLERELIIKDTQDREAASLFHIPAHLMHPDDAQKYVSFAAVPIKVHSFAKPWGVLIASSDRPNRFLTDGSGNGDIQTEPLRMLAGMIALLAANDYVRSTKNAVQTNAPVKLVHSQSEHPPQEGGTDGL